MTKIFMQKDNIVGFSLSCKMHFEDGKGNLLADGYLCTFIAGTDTPIETFKDENGETKNPTEIKLDSKGECDNIWLDESISYKFVLYDANRNLILVKDNLTNPRKEAV